MTRSPSNTGRSNDIYKADVQDMVKYPLKGKVNIEDENPAGKGTVKNETPILTGGNDYTNARYQRTAPTPNNLQKGKIRKIR